MDPKPLLASLSAHVLCSERIATFYSFIFFAVVQQNLSFCDTTIVVFEYVSSANEKEAKEAKAKLKKEEEKRELAQTLDVSCG